MKQDTRITQVLLTQAVPNGQRELVCWIDSKFAQLGKRVAQDQGGEVWVVSDVYNTKTVNALQLQYDDWRRFDDVLYVEWFDRC